MRLSDEQRVFLLNAVILIAIILLIWAMPRDILDPALSDEEPDERDDPPPATGETRSGEEALLVLLSEYNFDYEPRIRAAATSAVGICDAYPFITYPCEDPVTELAFAIENASMHGWIGYAAFENEANARGLVADLRSVDASKSGGYVSIEPGIGRITNHDFDEPDESLVLYHPTGTRFEHAWIARFGALIVYGYEATNERRITRKFTHAFDEELRTRVISSYNLSYTDFGFDQEDAR